MVLSLSLSASDDPRLSYPASFFPFPVSLLYRVHDGDRSIGRSHIRPRRRGIASIDLLAAAAVFPTSSLRLASAHIFRHAPRNHPRYGKQAEQGYSIQGVHRRILAVVDRVRRLRVPEALQNRCAARNVMPEN